MKAKSCTTSEIETTYSGPMTVGGQRERPSESAAAKNERLCADRALVERMVAGDERAFEAFADAYIPRLHRFALSRLRQDPELARDIAQATVCKAIAKLDTFRGESALFTWLCAVCRNEIAMHFRRQSSRPHEVELKENQPELEHLSIAVPSPEGPLLREESDDLVHHTLDRLPTHYADVLEWKYLEDCSVRQIAWRTKLQPKAAESLLTRARNAFRTEYAHVLADRKPRGPASRTTDERAVTAS